MHNRIKSARLANNMSQAKLADLLKVSRSAISQWECVEGSSPNTQHLLQIAQVLAINFEWLVTGNDVNSKRVPKIINEVQFDAAELEILTLIQTMPIGKKRSLLTFLKYR